VNSQNGWPANRDPKVIGVVLFGVAGVTFPQGVKDGDVKTVLGYVAHQFHNTVEPLHAGWCWGYDYRPIDGYTTLSNHSSGTAIDINAPDHPMGKSGTFNAEQVAAIGKILAFCGGVVRWGGNYSGRKDEMHFEIVGTPQAVARLAVKIGTPAPQPTHLVQKGDTGLEVTHYQQFLHDEFPAYRDAVTVMTGEVIKVDGDFGDQTEAWVKEFQKRTDLDQDGIIGPKTHDKMKEYGYKY
jgi:peptidoglycan hydrolase-like protein with peptidoglycan-binding domain